MSSSITSLVVALCASVWSFTSASASTDYNCHEGTAGGPVGSGQLSMSYDLRAGKLTVWGNDPLYGELRVGAMPNDSIVLQARGVMSYPMPGGSYRVTITLPTVENVSSFPADVRMIEQGSRAVVQNARYTCLRSRSKLPRPHFGGGPVGPGIQY